MKILQAHFQNWGIVRWKTLNWKEHKKFESSLSIKSPMAVSNDIYRACIIIGPNVSDATAGLVEFVVTSVFANSAFTGTFDTLNKTLNNKRNQLNDNFLYAARAVVAGIFGYKFEEMDEWDEDTFFMRLAQAEFVAGKPLPLGAEEEPQPIIQKQQEQPRPKKELSLAQQMVLDRSRGR